MRCLVGEIDSSSGCVRAHWQSADIISPSLLYLFIGILQLDFLSISPRHHFRVLIKHHDLSLSIATTRIFKMLNSIAFVLLASAQVITATALLPSFNARDVAPSDSLTYCSPIVAPSVPCTLTSSPISQVMFNMPGPASAGANNSYGAHFICYAQTSVG